MSKDFYVIDKFGDVWNEDPLPTFGQASSFRAYIKPLLNRITSLRIISIPRGYILKKAPSRKE